MPKYGPIVTYEEAPYDHVRTEFGFDVAQATWHRYASRAYRKHIGFRVARQLLYRTFREIYGIPARGILGPARSALPTYRWAVTRLIPAFLKAQIVLLGGHLPPEQSDPARTQFLLTISKAEYSTTSRNLYSKPGVGAHVLAFTILVIPKLGVLKILDTHTPTTETEDLFVASVNGAVLEFATVLDRLRAHPDSDLQFPNLDLDTGHGVAPGHYRLADQAHTKLLLRIVESRAPVSARLRDALLTYIPI